MAKSKQDQIDMLRRNMADLLDKATYLRDYASTTRNKLLFGEPITHIGIDDLDEIHFTLCRAENALKATGGK